MTKRLDGRVAAITGGGRGLGAAYAQLMAAQGARIVLNDVGANLDGARDTEDAVEAVAAAIRASGGEVVVNRSDVANFDQAAALVGAAIENYGRLDILINNAGILRDRMLVSMTEEEWDEVIRIHLKGHFCTTRHAAAHWRERAREGMTDAVLIQTSSIAGLHGNVGQTNYATAKSGIATMAHLNHMELHARYGVRCYAIAPSARTRLTLNSPGAADVVQFPSNGRFDYFDPANVAYFVTWLSAIGCPAPSGTVYGIEGDVVRRYDSWHVAQTIANNRKPWTFDELDRRADELIEGSARSFQPLADVMPQL